MLSSVVSVCCCIRLAELGVHFDHSRLPLHIDSFFILSCPLHIEVIGARI